MRGTDFERLATAGPVNATAARVTSGSTIQFDPSATMNPTTFHSATPLPVYPASKLRRIPKFVDLTGQRIGRLTVIGFLGKKRGDKGRWLVRCVCSYYEIRTTPALRKAIARGDQHDSRCYACLKNDAIRTKGRTA